MTISMKSTPWVAAMALCLALFSAGCRATPYSVIAARLGDKWSAENKRISTSLGERTFDRAEDYVFSAIIIALSEIDLPVKNLERRSGYIMAEGPMPLNSSRAKELWEPFNAEWRQLRSGWEPPQPDYDYTVVILVKKLGEAKTKVKIRVTCNSDAYVAFLGPESTEWLPEEIPPAFHREILKELWPVIDKQIFLDVNLD